MMDKVAIVSWVDSVAGRETLPGDIRRIWPVRSVGWVIRDDSEGILLANSRNPDGSIDYLNVVRGNVLSVVYLKGDKG